jgi:hypothetical protein
MSDGELKRVDPFRAVPDLTVFKPSGAKAIGELSAIREISEAAGFPSREPANVRQPRRWRTGRNTQINIKATAETVTRFATLADQRGLQFGELLKQLLDGAGA